MKMSWRSLTSCSSCTLYSTSSCFVASTLKIEEIKGLQQLQNIAIDKEIIEPEIRSPFIAIVTKGVLRSINTTADGRQEIIQLHKPGSIIGRPFEIDSKYGVESATPAVLCYFDRQSFEHLIMTNSIIAHGYMLSVLRELSHAREHAWFMASPRAFERIGRFIIAHCSSIRPVPSIAKLPVSRRDMAGFLSTTPETISRFVQIMVRAGVLRVRDTHTLLVLDLPRLKALAGQGSEPVRLDFVTVPTEVQKPSLIDSYQ